MCPGPCFITKIIPARYPTWFKCHDCSLAMEIHHEYNRITEAKALGGSDSRITSLVDLHLLIQIFSNPFRINVIASKGSNILINKRIFYMQIRH